MIDYEVVFDMFADECGPNGFGCSFRDLVYVCVRIWVVKLGRESCRLGLSES